MSNARMKLWTSMDSCSSITIIWSHEHTPREISNHQNQTCMSSTRSGKKAMWSKNYAGPIQLKTRCRMCDHVQQNTSKVQIHQKIPWYRSVQNVIKNKIKKASRNQMISTSLLNDLHAIWSGFGHLDISSIRDNSVMCSDVDHTIHTSIWHVWATITFPINRGIYCTIF